MAHKYQNIHEVIILEKNNDIFMGSSYNNQNRLHIGYHYPRSHNTRNLCKNGYTKFLEDYKYVVDDVDENYYVISNESTLDYNTYKHIFKYEEYNFHEIKNDMFTNIQENIICVNEKIINHNKSKKFFGENLKNVKIKCNYEVTSINQEEDKIYVNNELYCDILLNCTYGQLKCYEKENEEDVIYEKTISHIYKKEGDVGFDCMTIMDGEFPSLFVRDKEKKTYSLTHVKYTPILTSNDINKVLKYEPSKEEINKSKLNMEREIIKYCPMFSVKFTHEGYILGYKMKKNTNSGNRTCLIYENENYISVNGGKITGIYDFELYVDNFIENKNNNEII